MLIDVVCQKRRKRIYNLDALHDIACMYDICLSSHTHSLSLSTPPALSLCPRPYLLGASIVPEETHQSLFRTIQHS